MVNASRRPRPTRVGRGPPLAENARETDLPHDSLSAGADGLKVLVSLENGEARVADLDCKEVGVARRGRHGGSGCRVGHGPPLAGEHRPVLINLRILANYKIEGKFFFYVFPPDYLTQTTDNHELFGNMSFYPDNK
ncbi:jg15324 [Pararge aegeria aegeria]|uniref:Jg15324 protein n=1 Tax=Pararge aegeria aegeria TaxID=348720 RepID=A0A8S4R6Z5_9NEOP|nr:jg15324 [Pararge aegeria aegeria]